MVAQGEPCEPWDAGVVKSMEPWKGAGSNRTMPVPPAFQDHRRKVYEVAVSF